MLNSSQDCAKGGRPTVETEAIRSIRAGELLGPRGLLRIEHEGETYTLRLTRNNRLILTK